MNIFLFSISSTFLFFSVSAANNSTSGCITISLFPEPVGSIKLLLDDEDPIWNVHYYSDRPQYPIITLNSSYRLFNEDGELVESGQNSTHSTLCKFSNGENYHHGCYYLLLQGHGSFNVEWQEEVMEEGQTTVDNPKLIPIGQCSHKCGDLQQLIVFDAGGENSGDRSPLLINNKEATTMFQCMNPEVCYKIVGEAAYILSQNNSNSSTVIETGSTFQGYKQLGATCDRRICDGKPLLAETRRGKEIVVKLSSISGMKPLTDADSPQYQAACWLIYDDLRQLMPSNRKVIQRYILALLYFALYGSEWLRNYDFLTHKDECKWRKQTYHFFWKFIIHGGDGIQCNESGDVSRIVLGFNNLVGTIPQELSWLEQSGVIFLANNGLHGSIPSALGYLSNLNHLNLAWNRLTGSIPDSIARINSMQIIEIGVNMLTGTIPEFTANLHVLMLAGNILSGTLNHVGHLTSLRDMYLSGNQLSGTIAENFGHMKALVFLALSHNNLSGTIPSQLLNISRLEYLWLGSNFLSGTIPNIVANDSSLVDLSLDFNQLSGPVPSQLSALQSCQVIYLRDNRISGQLPSELNELQNLNKATLHNNDLTGIVPFDSCQKFQRLEADCDSPQKVLCPCCSSCHGIFAVHDIAALDCTSSELNIIFENLNLSTFIAFELLNDAGELIGGHWFISTESTYLYSRCISASDCLRIYFTYLSSPSDIKVVVNGNIILQEYVTEALSNYRFGFSSDGIMQKDTCDSIDLCNVEIEANSTKRVIVNKLAGIERVEYLNKPSSLQYNALCLWLKYIDKVDVKDLRKSEVLQYYFLTVFYYTANGQNWKNSMFWLSDKHYCNWYGVQCDGYNIVTSINLDYNHLKGPLASAIGELRGLEKLSLSRNELSGTIPASLGVQLPNLEEFNVSFNNLVGGLPSRLNFLENLVRLDLSHNQFTEKLPVHIGQLQYLQILNLFNNAFSGNLPDTFYKLTRLRKLSLGNNLFGGSTNRIVNLWNMEQLDLSDNFFTGDLPVSGRQSNLQVLKLSGNDFRGSISSNIETLQLLEEVLLFDNQLTGNLPSQIGNLPNLLELSVSHNKLKGSIPSSIGNLKKLTLLHLHGNGLQGPADYFDYDFDFIADCGSTYYYPALVECSNCSVCCTVDGDCLRTDSTWPRELIKSQNIPPWFSVFFLIVIGCGAVAALFFCFNRIVERDLDLIVSHNFQEGSVNRFFLSGDLRAFLIGTTTVLLQLSIAAVFIRMSDFTETRNDWRYSLNCPVDSLVCNNKRYITVYGWMVFGCIFFVYIARDILEGLQIIYESICFSFKRGIFAGFIVLVVSVSTTAASILYNYSTSESNTDIIKDAVILLFLIEIDEKVYEITKRGFMTWVVQQERQILDVLKKCLPGQCKSDFEEKDEEQPLGHDSGVNLSNNLDDVLCTKKDGIKALGEKVAEQKRLIDELIISSDQQKTLNDQLKFSNDQLQASNDRLKISNELLLKELNDIKAEFKCSNSLLLKKFDSMKEEFDNLKNAS